MIMIGHPMRDRTPRPDLKPREQVLTVLGTFRRLWPILWRLAPLLLLASAGINLAMAVVPAAQVYLTRALVEAATLVIAQGPALLPPAYLLLGLQVGLTAARSAMGALHRLVQFHLQRRAVYHLDQMVADKAARLPLSFFDRPDYHDQMQRAQAGLGMRGLGMIDAVLTLGQNLITVLSFLIILAQFHWFLAAAMLLLTVPVLLVNLRSGEWRFFQQRRQTQTVRKAGYLLNLLRGRDAAKEIRVFGLKQHLLERWKELYWQTTRELLAIENRAAWSRLGAEAVAAVAGAGAAGFLLWLGAQGRLTLGDYVALAAALISAQGLMQGAALQIARIYEDSLFISDLFEFLGLPEEEVPPEPRPFPAPLRQGIAVESISFSYPGSPRPVLRSVSLTIRPGEKVAIVGENGAGKTTLVKCLMGLYRPQEGVIRYDGTDVARIDPEQLRRNVTAIFQDFVRYHLTVRENIAFGRVEGMEDQAALLSAAAKGGADEVAASLEEGYETMVGSVFTGGQDLSYGQWQKLALSRAFFRDASVIVLDEPTAAMDPRAEAAVFERFTRLAAGKTALLISHRLGTCRYADRILVLKGGELIEDGTHEQLMARGGEYARMFQLQARWYVGDGPIVTTDGVTESPGPLQRPPGRFLQRRMIQMGDERE